MLKLFKDYGIKILIIATFALLLKNQQELVYESIYDSYIAVGVFVTITLFIMYFFEHYTQNSLVRFLKNHQKLQVPISSLLGALPGCGGAIIVVTNYSKGYVTFGSMVATLIAGSGDAAIILIQKKPFMAFILFIICTITAIITGYLIDYFTKNKFAKPKEGLAAIPAKKSNLPMFITVIWVILFAINGVFHFFPEIASQSIQKPFAYIGIALTLLLWVWKNPHHSCSESECKTCTHGTVNKVIIETSFIIAWIFIGMIGYKAAFAIMHFDVASFINSNIYYLPIAATIIGFIPGCGPQIVLTTFYVNGLIPFAAQVANTISNDGDSLMPAIAMQPKKALLATFYGIFPALIVGYTVLFFYKG